MYLGVVGLESDLKSLRLVNLTVVLYKFLCKVSLTTRLVDHKQINKGWSTSSKDTKDSTINQRLVEQTQEMTLSWKVVEVLPWMTP